MTFFDGECGCGGADCPVCNPPTEGEAPVEPVEPVEPADEAPTEETDTFAA